MTGSAIQALIDELAGELQRSVVVNDPDVVLLYASPHYGDEDEVRTHAILQRHASAAAIGHVLAQGVASWTAPGLVPPNPDIGMNARVCVPVRWHGELLGMLLVVDRDGTITTGELARMGTAAEQVAALLIGEQGAADEEAQAREAALAAALDPRPEVRVDALRRLGLEGELLPTAHLRVVSVGPRPGSGTVGSHVAGALRTAVSAPERAAGAVRRLAVVREDRATVLVGSPAPLLSAPVEAYAARLVRAADEVGVGRFTFVAGVGGPVSGLEQAWASHRQAALAARAAGTARGAVAAWADLGADAVLVRLPLAEFEAETLPDGLRRLLAADRDGRLVETLTTFLDHAGSVPATAVALRIHRTTLYYRLGKIAEVGRVDLDDGETRLALHLGLRVLARL